MTDRPSGDRWSIRGRVHRLSLRSRLTSYFADITTLVAADFMKPAKLAMPDNLANVKRWHAAVSARPSARA